MYVCINGTEVVVVVKYNQIHGVFFCKSFRFLGGWYVCINGTEVVVVVKYKCMVFFFVNHTGF